MPDGYLLERDAHVASVGGHEERKGLPKVDYHLDKSAPDVLVLRRQDSAFMAAFSVREATREGILEAAKEDYEAALLARVPTKGKRAGDENEETDPTGARG